MLRAIKINIFLLFLYGISLFAELYDPYYLEAVCDYRMDKHFVLFKDSSALFYFNSNMMNSIENIIAQARSEHKMIDIKLNKMSITEIRFTMHHYFFDARVYFLKNYKEKLEDYIKISDINIIYKQEIVKTENIRSLLWYYKYIKLSHQNKKYWLTDNQRIYLYNLIKNGAELIEINIDAIDHKKPYRDAIPLDNVFKSPTIIN